MSGYAIKTHKREPDVDLLERQSAGDLVALARRVTLERSTLDEAAREGIAKRFESLALELTNAAAAIRRVKPDDTDVPAYLQADGPELPARFLLRACDALTHD